MPKRPFALLLLLAGCATAPAVPTGPLPVAAQFPDATALAGAPRATDLAWESYFADPQLRALIAAALENNRDLRAATARIDEARAQYRIQRADRLPSLGLSAGASRARSQVQPGQSLTFNSFDVGVGVSAFELDFWGRVRNLSEAARASYLATVAAERAFRIALVADVAAAHLAQRELDERIAIAERTVATRVQSQEIARLRLDAGVTSALDFRQAETLLTQAETELAALRRQSAQNRNAIEVLVGGPLPTALPAPLPLAEQGISDAIAPGLPSDLLVNRPDILQAELLLQAAGANVAAARAAFLPRITLTGLLGFASTALGALFDGDSFVWSAGAAATAPIFDAGRTQGGVDAARAQQRIALAQYEQTVQIAFRDVADALAGRRYLAEQLTAQERALAAQRDRAELAELRYKNGVASFLEVLDAQRELFAAEQALVQTRRALLDNAVLLYAALGGGLAPPG